MSDVEYYEIACPNCGTTRRYPETMTRGGRTCSCGAKYRYDVEAREAVEVTDR